MTLASGDVRPLMFGIAYRMLGSVAEAEDVVQDAMVRMHERPTEMQSPRAYAATVTTRLAIDELRSARRRRERYVGTWLPEPLLAAVDGPEASAELRESISTAFLVLLERLAPVERAVFVLREAFGYGYDDLAAIVEKSADNCRQIYSRAAKRIADGRPRFEADPQRQDDLVGRFLAATTSGDLAALEQLLAADVTFYGDGGGKAQAVRVPVVGRVQVVRFLLGLARQGAKLGGRIEPAVVNGGPGGRVELPDGSIFGIFSLEVADGRVVAIRNVINPDKLRHLAG